jgi:THO complex subunit 2
LLITSYNSHIAELQKDPKADAKAKPDKNSDKIKKNIEILKQEHQSQQKEKEKIDAFLDSHKEDIIRNFFNSESNIAFVQYCCLPRLRLSPSDAIFTAKFFDTIMALKEYPYLDQLEFKFNIVKVLIPSVLSCSEMEAKNLGIFFKEILSFTENIHDNAKLYAVFEG